MSKVKDAYRLKWKCIDSWLYTVVYKDNSKPDSIIEKYAKLSLIDDFLERNDRTAKANGIEFEYITLNIK